jgi:hypothetical protein
MGKTMRIKARRIAGSILVVVGWALLLSACNNTYGPPPADGKPQNYGQQRYIDNQLYQQQTQDRMNLPE